MLLERLAARSPRASAPPCTRMQRLPFLALLIAASLAAPAARAQTTGKIQGTVTEASTGDPLPGVSVRIEGTTQGAATDIDGEYVIIGVRPGQYTVSFTSIGYAVERRTGVTISVDLTTTIDVAMREEAVGVEEVEVVADQDVVRRDVTSSEARVTAETIDRLPVQELGQIIGVQAGITDRGGIHIRGGRSSEVLYMVDGVPVTDAYDGSAAVQIENNGIQELQVISGTFNAEYGNAQSGVINVVTKEGRNDRYAGSVEAYSGTYLVGDRSNGRDFLLGLGAQENTVQGVQYRDVDPYAYLTPSANQYYNAAFGVEGPVFSPRVTFYGLGRYFRNDGWLYGARIYNPDGTLGDSSLVPLNNYEKFSGQGNLKFQVTRNMFVNLIALGSTSQSRSGDFGRRWSPDGRQRSFDDGLDTKVKFTHLLSNKTFYTVDVARFYRRAQSRLFENPNDVGYNGFALTPPDSVETSPGVFIGQDEFTGGGRFVRAGTDLGRFQRTTQTYFFKADITSQLTDVHLVKTGVQAKVENLDFVGFGLRDGDPATEGFQPGVPDQTSLDYNAFDNVRPFTVSAYAQDKIELESFIVNAGIRFDYFDARGRTPADPTDPNIFNPFKKTNIYRDTDGDGAISLTEESDDNQKTVDERAAYWYNSTSAKYAISPRLGVAYPITETGVIHFSYGYFLQIPTLNRLFDNYDYKIRPTTGSYGPFGNPDLENERTVMYELGLKQGIGDFVVDVTGYYRDVRNWVGVSPPIATELPGVTYTVYQNRDYANTRGVTLSVKRNYLRGYGYDLNYTFQVVDGGLSDGEAQFFQGNNAELVLLPLDWDQRHKVAGSLYAGGKNWGGSVLAQFGTGFPYTPSFPQAENVGPNVQPAYAGNSRRIPATFQVDANVYREFRVGGVRPRLFAQVYNLLDRRNVQGVYGDTGRPDVTQGQRTGEYDPGFFVNPSFYAEPRRVHVGVEFNF